MPDHTLAVTLAAPDDRALGEVDALAQAGLAWAICTTPGATVSIRCDCDQDDGPYSHLAWRDIRTALGYALGCGLLAALIANTIGRWAA